MEGEMIENARAALRIIVVGVRETGLQMMRKGEISEEQYRDGAIQVFLDLKEMLREEYAEELKGVMREMAEEVMVGRN